MRKGQSGGHLSPTRVAYSGEPGAFAEDAVIIAFDSPAPVPVPGFREAFEAVTAGRAPRDPPGGQPVAAGVVPIENLVSGTVRENYDLLLEHDLVVAGEVVVPVRLCLAALPGQSLADIERVYSHIQALGQAERFLRTRPWTLLTTYNTAGAAKMIVDRGERAAGAVLSPRAAAARSFRPSTSASATRSPEPKSSRPCGRCGRASNAIASRCRSRCELCDRQRLTSPLAASSGTLSPRCMQIPAGKNKKRRPVRRGRVSAGVLAERQIAGDERGFDGRKLRGSQILLAQQLVNRSGGNLGRNMPSASTQPSPAAVLETGITVQAPLWAQERREE